MLQYAQYNYRYLNNFTNYFGGYGGNMADFHHFLTVMSVILPYQNQYGYRSSALLAYPLPHPVLHDHHI